MTKSSLEETGELSPRQNALLEVISGFGSEGSSAVLVTDPVGEIFRARAAKAQASEDPIQSQRSSTSESDKKTQEEAIRSSHEVPSQLTSGYIDIIVDQLNERKRKLQSQRKQREPRAMFDVRSQPLHADRRLHRRRPSHLGRPDVIMLHHRDRRRVSIGSIRASAEFGGCV